jgi:serine/threonine protein kinase
VPLAIGHALHGKYRLVRLLGDGGMGSVYEAVHVRLGTHVAVKVLHPELTLRPGIVDRFLREARVSAQIKCPHVAQTMDVDRTPEGEAYMVMELLEGETLLHLLERERKLSVGVACAFTLQILEALEVAHDVGVVHRDLKPENVFVTHGTQKTVVKLIDFGIAKARRDGEANLTLAGVTMGTAEYMAPEQAFSADQADARSDLYAVGVLLYEMLSGVRPVEGDDPRVIAVKVERGDVKPLVHALPSVPPPLAGLVHRAMAARPEVRFQSAPEMRLALQKLVGHDAGGTLPLPLAVQRRAPHGHGQGHGHGDAHDRPHATGTLRGTPVDGSAAGGTSRSRFEEPLGYEPPSPDIFAHESEPPPAPPTHGSKVPLVALAVLLGVGVVVAFAYAQSGRSSASSTPGGPATSVSEAPPAQSLAVVSATASAAASEAPDPSSSALPTLSRNVAPHGVHHAAKPKADGGTVHSAPSATASHRPFLSLPSSLPPIPSTIPTDLTLPGFGP